MSFPALRPSKLVRASSEQEALDAAMLVIREDLVAAHGEAARELPLEPFLVVELQPGLWDVMVDTPTEAALIPAGAEITF